VEEDVSDAAGSAVASFGAFDVVDCEPDGEVLCGSVSTRGPVDSSTARRRLGVEVGLSDEAAPDCESVFALLD